MDLSFQSIMGCLGDSPLRSVAWKVRTLVPPRALKKKIGFCGLLPFCPVVSCFYLPCVRLLFCPPSASIPCFCVFLLFFIDHAHRFHLSCSCFFSFLFRHECIPLSLLSLLCFLFSLSISLSIFFSLSAFSSLLSLSFFLCYFSLFFFSSHTLYSSRCFCGFCPPSRTSGSRT